MDKLLCWKEDASMTVYTNFCRPVSAIQNSNQLGQTVLVQLDYLGVVEDKKCWIL
jgi:hypothetical protein